MRTQIISVFAALLATTNCLGSQNPLQPLPAGGHHVLFVGNSLTYYNDLPGTLAALAASVGDTIRVAEVTAPDFALIDHLNAGRVQKAIALGGWEFVVLQQGPSTVKLNRDSLILWTKMFEPLVRAVGARPALYMVWPDAGRTASFDECRLSYQLAAQAVNGDFFPAGQAWRAAWSMDATLPLYGADGFHPSPLGTYLAALVMYERITGHDARNLPGEAVVGGQRLNASVATVRLLQNVAHDTNAQHPKT